MTQAEYDNEMRRLKGAVTRARNKVRAVETLREKIAQKIVALEVEECLRQHKLNYHLLVVPS